MGGWAGNGVFYFYYICGCVRDGDVCDNCMMYVGVDIYRQVCLVVCYVAGDREGVLVCVVSEVVVT